ncbi:hypothetical protein ACIRL2_39305 [Embleya sp. NPDC127516]|uniref:hypothetical protein n=1 Tax=Embleya sp. NPDC127516 TaxID=3363990 RepID=UPI0037FAE2A0
MAPDPGPTSGPAEFGGPGISRLFLRYEDSVSMPAVLLFRVGRAGRIVPGDILQAFLAAELRSVSPLPGARWEWLGVLVRTIRIDRSWSERPGSLLADAVRRASLDRGAEFAELAEACAAWTRVQALAVIDACQRDDIAALPTRDRVQRTADARDFGVDPTGDADPRRW